MALAGDRHVFGGELIAFHSAVAISEHPREDGPSSPGGQDTHRQEGADGFAIVPATAVILHEGTGF